MATEGLTSKRGAAWQMDEPRQRHARSGHADQAREELQGTPRGQSQLPQEISLASELALGG
jgi:hypothetical protein